MENLMLFPSFLKTTAAVALLSATASAHAVLVTDLTPGSGWSDAVTTAGGSAAIVSLNGLGGNLENNAPDANGAVRLTTDGDTSTRAEAGIGGNFGIVSDIFGDDLSFTYTWYNSGDTGGPAAPSFKLAFYDINYAGDGYGQLIYEPYWQSADGNSTITPVTNDWVTTTIDLGSGLFWNSGMFGIGSSAGGPPNRTLGEWLNAFNAADPNGFAQASLVGVSVGMGTYNINEVGYFDQVGISGTLADAQYDFAAAQSEVPAPAPLALLLLGLAALGVRARIS
jgi:hypothetical protein